MLARLLALLIVSVALTTTVSAQSSADNLRKITLAPAGDGLHFIPLHVAINGGLFEQEGLKVDWVNVSSGPRTAAAITGGSADLAPLGFAEVIRSAKAGSNIVAVATEYNTYAMSMVLSNDALKRTGITQEMPIDQKVDRLDGLTIGISTPGSSTDLFARSLFAARKMDADKSIRLQPIGDGNALFAAFQKGVTDGFIWSAPVPELAVTHGLGQVAISPFRGEVPELQDVVYGVLVTSREKLEKDPELIRSAVRAYTRALKLIHDNPEEARRLTRMSFKQVEEGAFNLAFDTYLKGIPTSSVITPQQLAHTLEWGNITAKTPVDVKYEAVVAPDIAKEAMKDIFGQ